jgi:hypothetical protein
MNIIFVISIMLALVIAAYGTWAVFSSRANRYERLIKLRLKEYVERPLNAEPQWRCRRP